MGDRLQAGRGGGRRDRRRHLDAGRNRRRERRVAAEAGLGKEVPEKDSEWTEEEREERPAAVATNSFAEDTSDPVRMYLQEIGAVSLLSREQEVEIAKQIEEGEKQVREHVLNHPFLIRYLLEIADRIKAGELSERELQDEEADDEIAGGRRRGSAGDSDGVILKTLEKLRKLSARARRRSPKRSRKLRKPTPAADAQAATAEQRVRRVLDELQLGKRHITTVVEKLKKAERFLDQQQRHDRIVERAQDQAARTRSSCASRRKINGDDSRVGLGNAARTLRLGPRRCAAT